MIRLELAHALGLYSAILAAGAIGIWLYTEVSIRRPQRSMGKQYLWRCIICGYSYLDEEATEMSECPQCGTILSAHDRGARELVSADTGKTLAPDGPAPEEKAGGSSRRKRPTARRRGPRRRR